MPNKVRERRVELGKTQEWLASKVGVTRQTIFDIEHEKTKPRAELALKISKTLGRLCEELFSQEM